jgi:O-acetyl-ADP-ribose deacetylase (regulator of RNase III)
MITEKTGNLLEAPVDVMVHQANLYHTFGAGIAAQIKKHLPEAYEADCATVKGDPKKLGTYSIGKITKSIGQTVWIKRVVNLYSQVGIGGQDRNTSYDSMVVGLTKLRDQLEDAASKGVKYKLGIPYQMGCGLANGSWPIVRAIIEDIFGKSIIEVEIYKLPDNT